MNAYSITRRLIATVLLIELIAALCVTGVALGYERHAHFRAFDVLLRGRADSLLGAVQDAEDANDNVMLDGTETTMPPDDLYQVVDAGGRVLGQSKNWPGTLANSAKQHLHIDSHNPGSGVYFETPIHGRMYRVLQMQGLRVVDPGDKGGGIRRYVTIYYGSSVERVWGAVLRAVGFYAIGNLLILACTGIVMSWLLKRGLAPLHELAASASKVSVTAWTFSPPDRARATLELTPLVTALETLLKGLERSFEQQKRFVGDAAHELKTSAALVKSSLQLLAMKQRSPAEYQAGVDRALTDCERMEAIVARMLTLARVEESTGASALRLTEIFACLRQVTLELESMAEVSQIPILIHGDAPLTVRVDPDEFKLLYINLLMNALQHSPPESVIRIDVRQEAAQAVIRIRDDGDGIAPESLPHIFDRFFRSDPSRSRKTGGTGLGLAICKAIVDKSEGTISIESTLNLGTTVVVRFPVVSTSELAVTNA